MAGCATRPEDEEAVQALYEKIAGSLHLADNYLILLAADRYDVPFRSRDGFQQDEGQRAAVFLYTLQHLPREGDEARPAL